MGNVSTESGVTMVSVLDQAGIKRMGKVGSQYVGLLDERKQINRLFGLRSMGQRSMAGQDVGQKLIEGQ